MFSTSGGWRTLQSLVRAIEQLGCTAVASGIENSADMQCLVELGCRYGQGDYFGSPQPIAALTTAAVAGIGL